MAKISYIGRSIMPQEFMQVRQALGLPVLGFPIAARAVRDDLFNVVVLLDGETLVGCARVIGDGVLTFLILDVLVAPKYQRKGVGSKMLGIVLGYLETVAEPGAFVGLMAAPGTEAFFAKHGFAARPDDAPGMQIALQQKVGQA
ncbi:MAG: GNAT family N-acetyltransferase [Candidatus Methylomirabilia bacterium]